MIFRSIALLILLIFYSIYFYKQIQIKKLNIDMESVFKIKKNGNNHSEKNTNTDYFSLMLKISCYILFFVQMISIYKGHSYFEIMPRIIGIYLGVTGDIIFFLSVYYRNTKKTESKKVNTTENDFLFNENGIYKYSRNPAYIGFLLCYLGILFMYCNVFLLIFSLISLALLSIRVHKLEKYYSYKLGEKYLIYKKTVHRYIGRGKTSFKGICCLFYLCLFLFSAYYTVTCLIYCGPHLSLIWIWPMLAIFSLLRFIMIKRDIENKRKFKSPKIFRLIYYILVSIFLISFFIVESFIIGNMNAIPRHDLDYVVVLGAGLRGSTPSNPLRQRINKAFEYMSENENTIVIASGGQGPDEAISEAECIKNYLIDMGADPDRILLENQSTSTDENIRFSFKIINSEDKKVGIISNGFHMFRAKLIAINQGHHNIYSVPGKTLFPVGIHYCVREYFGIMALIFLS